MLRCARSAPCAYCMHGRRAHDKNAQFVIFRVPQQAALAICSGSDVSLPKLMPFGPPRRFPHARKPSSVLWHGANLDSAVTAPARLRQAPAPPSLVALAPWVHQHRATASRPGRPFEAGADRDGHCQTRQRGGSWTGPRLRACLPMPTDTDGGRRVIWRGERGERNSLLTGTANSIRYHRDSHHPARAPRAFSSYLCVYMDAFLYTVSEYDVSLYEELANSMPGCAGSSASIVVVLAAVYHHRGDDLPAVSMSSRASG